MVLLVVGFIFLGKSFGIRTVYVSVLMSVGLSLAEVWFPMEHPLTTQPVLELMYADCAAGIQCGDHVQYRSIRRRYGYYRHDP